MIDSRPSIASGTLIRADEEIAALPIWSLTLGIFALLTFGLTAVPSIVCGHLALAQTRQEKGKSFAKSVSLTGLAIGYIGATILGIWIVVLVGYLLR
jgi:hypothetical protein